jgi:hypothetical protein
VGVNRVLNCRNSWSVPVVSSADQASCIQEKTSRYFTIIDPNQAVRDTRDGESAPNSCFYLPLKPNFRLRQVASSPAMFAFLDEYYEMTKSDDIGALLGSMMEILQTPRFRKIGTMQSRK